MAKELEAQGEGGVPLKAPSPIQDRGLKGAAEKALLLPLMFLRADSHQRLVLQIVEANTHVDVYHSSANKK